MSEIITTVVASLAARAVEAAAKQIIQPSQIHLETRISILQDSLELQPDDAATLMSVLRLPSVELLASVVVEVLLSAGSESDKYETAIDETSSDFAEIAKSEGRLARVAFSRLKEFWVSVMHTVAEPYDQLRFDSRDLPVALHTDGSSSLERHSSDLLTIARDPGRLRSLMDLSRQIGASTYENLRDLRISHAMEEHRRQFDELYVTRNLQLEDGSISRAGGTRSPRLVITGPPGVGKSTFVTQLLRLTESQSRHATTPMLLRAREAHPDNTLVSEITRSVRNLTQINGVTEAQTHDLLTLGLGLIVFDGIDEIRSLAQRKSFVAAIEAFGLNYPRVDIVVTSREVGYNSTPLAKQQFIRATLAPFSDAQVEEYARRWFTPLGQPELMDGFMRDVSSLDEIKTNPLMLSLLCTLYTARGYLPNNRRLVYVQCTQLLFHQWDAMRQIKQPSDLRNYGEDLMQDLAHLYYRSTNAQSGLQERVLQGVVEDFFKDSAGVLPAEARTRAREFLEFCADRAWLLGVAGVDDFGERVFTFTHQTFLEFFAAEYLARTRSIDQISGDIIEAYEKNSSSLVPELMIQASEAARRRSGVEILRNVKERERLIAGRGHGRFLGLRIRLIAASKPGPSRLDEAFEEALTELYETATTGSALAVCRALLLLSEDQRSRLQNLLRGDDTGVSRVTPSSTGKWRAGFLTYWCALAMAGESFLYEHDWKEFVSSLYEHFEIQGDSPWPLRVHALREGRIDKPIHGDDLDFRFIFGDLEFEGPAMNVLESVLNGGAQTVEQPDLITLLCSRVRSRGADEVVARDVLRAILNAYDDRGSETEISAALQKTLLPLYCLALEMADEHQAHAVFFVAGAEGPRLEKYVQSRSEAATRLDSNLRSGNSTWIKRWSQDQLALVRQVPA